MRQGWEIKTFEEVFDLQMGKTPSRDNLSFWRGENVWVSIADMNNQKYISTSKEKITNDAVKNSGIKCVKRGTAIMSFKLSIGKTAIAQTDLYTNEAIMSFNLRSEYSNILSEYIYYYLRGYKWQGANKAVMGLTLNKKTIAVNQFCFPSSKEQQKIVEELDCLSNMIELKKKQMETYDKLAQSIFYDMFGDPISNNFRWQSNNIGTFATCIAGATPSTSIKEYWENGEIPWLSSGEVGKGRITDTEKKITKVGYDSCSTRMIPPHTIVIAMAGQGKTRGTVGVAEITLCTNQSICSIVCNDSVNVDFLYYQLRFLYNELRSISNGDGGRGGLNLKLIQGFKVILPPLLLQQEFASKIEAIEKQKELIKQSIAETETLFNSRMDYYFN